MTVLDEVSRRLSPLERVVWEPVLRADGARVDEVRSSYAQAGGMLTVRVCSVGDVACSFELGFGRDAGAGAMNFYIGLGASFCTFETLETRQDAEELADDVEQFLRSVVRCTSKERDGVIRRADYWVDRLETYGPLRYSSPQCGWRALLPARRRTRTFEPWVLE